MTEGCTVAQYVVVHIIYIRDRVDCDGKTPGYSRAGCACSIQYRGDGNGCGYWRIGDVCRQNEAISPVPEAGRFIAILSLVQLNVVPATSP